MIDFRFSMRPSLRFGFMKYIIFIEKTILIYFNTQRYLDFMTVTKLNECPKRKPNIQHQVTNI